jgi:CBS domain containing-hemolysin-like protein
VIAISLQTISEETLSIPGTDPWYASPADPALSVMTDFRERASVVVTDSAPIDAALEHMRHAGVRCAFAIDEARNAVVGLITAYDISSEKPLAFPYTPRREVLVRDIMQKIADWRVIEFADLEPATVGSVAQVFDNSRLTHIPVVETNAEGKRSLRGLLSSAKLKRRLLTK